MKSRIYQGLLIVLCLILVSLACDRSEKQIIDKFKEGMDDPSGCDLTDQLKITSKLDLEETREDGSYQCSYTVTFSSPDPNTNAHVMIKTHTQEGCYDQKDETIWESWGGWGAFEKTTFGDYSVSVDKDCVGDGIRANIPEKAAMIRADEECNKIKDDNTYLEIFAQDIYNPCKYPKNGD